MPPPSSGRRSSSPPRARRRRPATITRASSIARGGIGTPHRPKPVSSSIRTGMRQTSGVGDRSQPIDRLDRVDGHADPSLGGEVAHPRPLAIAPHRVGDQDVVDARVDEHLGLADLGHGQARSRPRRSGAGRSRGSCGTWRGAAASPPRFGRLPPSARCWHQAARCRSSTAGVSAASTAVGDWLTVTWVGESIGMSELVAS